MLYFHHRVCISARYIMDWQGIALHIQPYFAESIKPLSRLITYLPMSMGV